MSCSKQHKERNGIKMNSNWQSNVKRYPGANGSSRKGFLCDMRFNILIWGKAAGVHGLLKDRLRNYEIYELWTKENIKKTWRIRSRFLPGTEATHGFPQSTDCEPRTAKLPGSEKYPPGAPRIRPFYWDIAKAYQDERERTLDPWESMGS